MSSTSEFYNNISYSTRSDELFRNGGGTHDYNCYGSYGGIGEHSVTGYPGFADEESHDYRLTTGSPCFNSGRTEGAPLLDLDSLPRPDGVEIDMGAYEYPYPQLRISGPDQDSLYIPPATIPVTAEVSRNDHPVSRVEFFGNDSLLGTLNTPPWELTWQDAGKGEHWLYARGTDSAGNVFHSKMLEVRVLPSAPPEAYIVTPTDGELFEIGDTVEILVEASDDGEIDSVEFLVDAKTIGSDTVSPFSCTWVTTGTGTYVLSARATDNTGQRVTTGSVTITVMHKVWNINYFEDFEDGLAQEWVPRSGSWEVHEGEYWNSTNGILDLSIYEGSTFATYEYSVKAKPDWGNPFGLVFNFADEENYLLAKLDAAPLDASIIQVKDGEETTLTEGSYQGGGIGNWVTVKVINDGFFTSLLVNGTTVFDSITTSGPKYGRIGLLSQFNWLWFDDVRVGADTTMLPSAGRIPAEPPATLEIYPNPVSGEYFTIRTRWEKLPLDMEIWDLAGRKCHGEVIRSEQVKIPRSLPGGPGVYILRMSGTSGTTSRKLILE